ncbi:hypothetical protein DAPPUDRAFT_337495 [Daphnia pulex]|uniref:Uncharacterized protein n=1 Tax=Daphnia pulex TaxID=6669 RepID=E9I1R4_DAPPU|nr:hypothetical protein DAPPUDRAFT_337495 [Daphnia pulex]|eukprot:EFX62067.1 hypothetical protein DAPPUDRAFT_337495 [Daphnia pulex]
MLLHYFITLSLASGNVSHMRSNAVGCCSSIITVFHHEHFSVLLTKEHSRSPQTSLIQCWILSFTESRDFHQRSAPSSSSRLIQLYCFSASYAASPATQLFLLHWRALQLL